MLQECAGKTTARKLSHDPLWKHMGKLELELQTAQEALARLRNEALVEVAAAKEEAEQQGVVLPSLQRLADLLQEGTESS